MSAVDRAVNIEDLRRQALRRLPRFLGDYIERGAGDGGAARRNVEVFRGFALRPRALEDVSTVDTRAEVFGGGFAAGFGISAVGAADIFRPHADELLAEAAEEAGAPFILSGASFAAIETIRRRAPQSAWAQIYGAATPALTDEIVARIRDAGVPTLVFTVDVQIPPRSEVAQRSGASLRSLPSAGALPGIVLDALAHPRWTFDFLRHGGVPRMESWAAHAGPVRRASDITRFFHANGLGVQGWRDLERLRRNWPGPLVVKGLVRPEDVTRAWDMGVEAITVSNHGGNKLDRMEATLESLIHVRRSVDPSVRLFFDGGIRRGADIVVAHALGADFCFVGRSTLYGVVAGGLSGARRALQLLQSDLAHTLAMTGHRSLKDVAATDVTPLRMETHAP